MMDYTGKNVRESNPPFPIISSEYHSVFEEYACAEFCVNILQIPFKFKLGFLWGFLMLYIV